MQVSCPHCSRVLEYSGDPPVFCGYCGQRLGDGGLLATGAYERPSGIGSGEQTEAVPRSGLGAALEAEADPEQVADYRIVRLLGRGGMGSVYEAEDVSLGRRVALKLIGAQHVTSTDAVERFRQEGRLASTIAHPRCVFVLAAEEFEGRPYIVMELMPGETLQTLVERSGPLPVAEAIAKILDVIEGLREAHLLGVIHRDVKPSNCFLDAEGRVKVGDFGLSKSLDGDAALTRTGSFVGTPLYASPEQIKREPLDERTDVYSAAATLYYLLTGRPPFQAGDAAAALAKIVSESPTPMRACRPELPAALEAAVLRGLDRDRDRRWSDLERFRDALLPFVAGQLRWTDMALRITAYLTDGVILVLAHALLVAGYVLGTGTIRPGQVERALGVEAARWLTFVVYFGVLESIWGSSPGKRLTGLRVARMGELGPPSLPAALGRAAVVCLFTSVAGNVVNAGVMLTGDRPRVVLADSLTFAVILIGSLLLALPMRVANGFRGLHEFASGTRTVRLARLGRRRVPRGRKPRALPALARGAAPAAGGRGILDTVGPFHVHGAVRWDDAFRVLLGEDPSLKRLVWLVLRPRGSPPPAPARRNLGRPGRPRWLAGGEQSDYRWDAYAPQIGCSLADLSGPVGLEWVDVRPMLHDLAQELLRAKIDGTLPATLGTDQVWIQPDGSVQLVDPLEPVGAPVVDGASVGPPTGSGLVTGGEVERSLGLLRRTAVLALEGGRRERGPLAIRPIRAAVPVHAARMLDRLMGCPRPDDGPYADLAAFVADLEADGEKPVEVEIARRAAHLGLSGLGVVPLLGLLLRESRPGYWHAANPWWWPHVALPLALAAWAAATRGGLFLRLVGLALVRHDSRPAEPWRCALRALLAWGPVAALLAAAERLALVPGWTLWGLAVVSILAYPLVALMNPARAFVDRLTGTWIVPR